jgi:hypothetical protein
MELLTKIIKVYEVHQALNEDKSVNILENSTINQFAANIFAIAQKQPYL